MTTFEGLNAYREIVAKKDVQTPDSADVIRYDYQIMDDIVWLLMNCGYEIVRKNRG